MIIIGHERDIMICRGKAEAIAVSSKGEDGQYDVSAMTSNGIIKLGSYASRERAKEVLADIVWCSDTVYQMPLE